MPAKSKVPLRSKKVPSIDSPQIRRILSEFACYFHYSGMEDIAQAGLVLPRLSNAVKSIDITAKSERKCRAFMAKSHEKIQNSSGMGCSQDSYILQ